MGSRIVKKDDRFLFNQKGREQLKADLAEEEFARRICSFYRYILLMIRKHCGMNYTRNGLIYAYLAGSI